MKRSSLLGVFILLLCACQSDGKQKKVHIVNEVPAHFEMYKTSEMAELMREMLANNLELKEKIINGENIGEFNEAYLKIHSAEMTDVSQRDATYPAFANHFEKMQKSIYSVKKTAQKEQFNKMVNSCVACHQDRCAGPIPRIKQLTIR